MTDRPATPDDLQDRPTCTLAPPDWLFHPAVRRLVACLPEGRFVGGAVRDTLLARQVNDLDLAVPLPPDKVIARLSAAGITVVPTGLSHGTVTAVIDHLPIEVTSLRRDCETDGRHAVVAFTDSWAEDAARRDFTMNALYLDPAGRLYDPTGGLTDCRQGRIRFVGTAEARLEEDVLRLLRFYRFAATYARVPLDRDARAACTAMAPRLHRLAGERIRVEMLKLLSSPDPAPILGLMCDDRICAEILPDCVGLAVLDRLIAMETEPPDPLRRLAALLPADDPAEAIAIRWRLANKDRDRLLAMTTRPDYPLGNDPVTWRRALYRYGVQGFCDRFLLRAAREATGTTPTCAQAMELARNWVAPTLPIGGKDAVECGYKPGPIMGRALKQVETWWIAGDFQADRAACRTHLARILPTDRETGMQGMEIQNAGAQGH